MILTLTRDLGVNLAGVEVVLDLRARLTDGRRGRAPHGSVPLGRGRARLARRGPAEPAPERARDPPAGAAGSPHVLTPGALPSGGTAGYDVRTLNQRRADDDSGLLRRYLLEISKYPPLSAEREKELARVIQDRLVPEERRKEAIDELVRANLRFVVYHAKGFHSANVPFIDLINEGNIGLLQAARRFDANRNVKFITYAVWWVRQAISHALAEQAGTIRIPHKQATHQFRAVRARDELQRELGREPTHEEIADRTGLEPAAVETLLSVTRNAESLSQGVGSDEQERTLEDVLEQTMVSSADDDMLRRASAEQAREFLGELKPKERAVLCRRFGIPEDGSEGEREPMTLQEIGLELDLSRERVRQIEAQALQRLRRSVKARRLLSVLR